MILFVLIPVIIYLLAWYWMDICEECGSNDMFDWGNGKMVCRDCGHANKGKY